MEVVPVLVAFHSLPWIGVAIESYLEQFPGERFVVVDNNPRRGENCWDPSCEEERDWLAAHPAVRLLENPRLPGHRLPDGRLEHGSGLDRALGWCRENGARVLVHLEPDCLVSGRRWRENLLGAIDAGAWMAGSHRQSHGPIHPTPSAWLVAETRASFRIGPWTDEDRRDPHFAELLDPARLETDFTPQGRWICQVRYWDTGHRGWFEAAARGRAALVDAPDFRHYWHGSVFRRLSERSLAEQFPEVRPFLDRARSRRRPRPVEGCPFRDAPGAEGGTEVARCRLLHQLSGVADAAAATVRRDACAACCTYRPPAPDDLNPVVASLLYDLAGRVVEQGGVPGCTAAQAARLRHRAECELVEELP